MDYEDRATPSWMAERMLWTAVAHGQWLAMVVGLPREIPPGTSESRGQVKPSLRLQHDRVNNTQSQLERFWTLGCKPRELQLVLYT